MNLTYVIGNGFDLGLGLKTSYRDFLRCYLCKESSYGDPPSARILKDIICQNQDFWGDAEREFGKLDYLEFGERNALVSYAASAYDNFCARLHRYIRRVEDQFPTTIEENVSEEFKRSLVSIHDEISVDSMNRASSWGKPDIQVNFITFNYTQTLERMLGNLSSSTRMRVAGREFDVGFHAPLHVHGEVQHGDVKSQSRTVNIVFGIGGSSQLTGIPYKGYECEFEQLKGVLTKKDDEKACQESVVSKAVSLIRESDYIVLFGVSLGVTDCFWWKAILEILRANPTVKLVFSPFHDDGWCVCAGCECLEKKERRYVAEQLAVSCADKNPLEMKEQILKEFGDRILIVRPKSDGMRCVYDPLDLSGLTKKMRANHV